VSKKFGDGLFAATNNAFYAVNEAMITADDVYQPTVCVQTKKLNDSIKIKVFDILLKGMVGR
jgi:hypothetical protein